MKAIWLTILPFLLAPSATAQSAAFEGVWTGGFGDYSGDYPFWRTAAVEIRTGDDGLEVLEYLPEGKDPLKATMRGDALRFRLKHGDNYWSLAVRAADGRLSGTAMRRGETVPVSLAKVEIGHHAETESLFGLYTWEGGGHFALRGASNAHFVLTDFTNGMLRVLYPRSRDEYSLGHRLAVPAPEAGRLRFLRDEDGVVTGATLEHDGELRKARRGPAMPTEPFEYAASDGTVIRGTLSLPEGDGPFPGAVWVHGSGRATRAGAGSWVHFMVSQGFAVLAVDKRGVGESGGIYELPDGGHDNRPHMQRRSRDVAAAVVALKKHTKVRDDLVGLIGASQAGWVMPQACQNGDAAFQISISGGATALSYESKWSDWASEEGAGSDSDLTEVMKRLRRHRPRDPDFREYFEGMTCPGLWLYGLKDRSNPSELCIEMIENVRQAHARDFTVEAFPNGSHSLLEARFGGAAEAMTLGWLVPELHAKVAAWLSAKGFSQR